MSLSEREVTRILQRKYRLPEQLRRARSRVEALEAEARLYGVNAILTDPTVVDQAWEREIELARIEGSDK
jgi:hypothetical protein